eukprot:7237793-Alexandrium_andersonii.AAC.1
MSASLVGSEMCIRDRVQAETGRPWRRAVAAAAAAASAPKAICEGERKETVSYTHLTLPTICSV